MCKVAGHTETRGHVEIWLAFLLLPRKHFSFEKNKNII
jgi:hypothetical protein